MAEIKAGGNPMKLAAGVVLAVASVALFIHRIPDRKFVEVHEDKPRPKKAGDEAAAAAPAKNLPKVEAPAPKTAPPAKGGPGTAASPTMLASAPLTLRPAADPALVDLTVACAAENGLFCNHIPVERLQRCLTPYGDSLLRDCREALEIKGVKFEVGD